jgi:hypothetical protein
MYEGLDRLPGANLLRQSHRYAWSGESCSAATSSRRRWHPIKTQYLYFLAARAALKLSEAAQQTGDPVQAQVHAARAFDYMECGRARALLDLMAGSATLARASDTETQIMRDWRRITAQLTVWRGLLAHEHSRVGAAQSDQQRIAALEQQIEGREAELRKVEARLATRPLLHQALGAQAQSDYRRAGQCGAGARRGSARIRLPRR